MPESRNHLTSPNDEKQLKNHASNGRQVISMRYPITVLYFKQFKVS